MKASEYSTEKNIGQLCWFSHCVNMADRVIGILIEYNVSYIENMYITTYKYDFHADSFEHCQPLSAEEIQQFMELVK